MWPFGRKGVASRLTSLDEATEVEIVARMLSPNAVASPITGAMAAIVHVEVFERIARNSRGTYKDDSLGELIVGGLVSLRDEDGVELSLVARRATFRFGEHRAEGRPLAAVPPLLAPHLRTPMGAGRLIYREHLVREGDDLRLQAIVEPSQHAVALGYRSTPRTTFITRDDLAPVFLQG